MSLDTISYSTYSSRYEGVVEFRGAGQSDPVAGGACSMIRRVDIVAAPPSAPLGTHATLRACLTGQGSSRATPTNWPSFWLTLPWPSPRILPQPTAEIRLPSRLAVLEGLRGARREPKNCPRKGALRSPAELRGPGGNRMTSEVAVMNKLAVALAADSAVTITTERGDKVYNTANKLFTISKFAPVGILIYNSTEINDVPLEVIVKEFRESLARKRYNSLKEYVTRFLSFLQSGPPMTEESREINFRRLIVFAIRTIYLRALRIRARDEDPQHDFHAYLRRSVEELTALLKTRGRLRQFKGIDCPKVIADRSDDFRDTHKAVIEFFREQHDIPDLDDELLNSIELLSAEIVFGDFRLPGYNGIVIAGYGEKEYFPSLIHYRTEGFTPFGLRCFGPNSSQITHNNEASLNAFAQREMTQVFMEGVDRNNIEHFQAALGSIFDELPALIFRSLGMDADANKPKLKILATELKKTLDKFYADFRKYRREEYTTPVIDSIKHLDKSDLALMAESLVAITALKRRVTLGAETVGGPIDVAVISKGDGFIWVKRKHYFDEKLNLSFMQRYLPPPRSGRDRDGTTKKSRQARVRSR
jgi:hypothetical protein